MPQYHIAYALVPYKRNQDVIRIVEKRNDALYVVSVTDGWNELSLNSDEPGRQVAELVAELYPNTFLSAVISDTTKRARAASIATEAIVTKRYPTCSTCVAAFLFHYGNEDTIVTVGDPEIYVLSGSKWYKPVEISDHALDPIKYASNVSRFFGCPKRKKEPLYTAEPDVVTLPSGVPIILATDGIKDVLSVDDVNHIWDGLIEKTSKIMISALFAEIQLRGGQKDDISILVRWEDQQ